MEYMKSKKKIIIPIIVISSIVATYFVGTFFGTIGVSNSLFHKRTESVEQMLQYPYNEMQYVRSDYPNLNERTEIMFDHGKIKLAGYLYETNNPLGLVVCAHGVNSFADGDNAQLQSYF